MAVEKLVKAGIPVVLRIDPLFPRGVEGCREYQHIEEDLTPLISWAAYAGITHVISSPLKLVYRRNTVPWFNQSIIKVFQGVRGSYRPMAMGLQQTLMDDLKSLSQANDLQLHHCFANILNRDAYFLRNSPDTKESTNAEGQEGSGVFSTEKSF